MTTLNTYLCFFQGKQIDLMAETMFAAKELAIKHFNVRPNRQHLVSAHYIAMEDAAQQREDAAILKAATYYQPYSNESAMA